MCVLLSSVRQGAVIQPRWTEKVSGRINERGRAAHGLSRAEVLTRRSAIPSGSNSMICKWGRHITPGLSDNVYLQNYACGYLNGRYRKFTVNYAPTK